MNFCFISMLSTQVTAIRMSQCHLKRCLLIFDIDSPFTNTNIILSHKALTSSVFVFFGWTWPGSAASNTPMWNNCRTRLKEVFCAACFLVEACSWAEIAGSKFNSLISLCSTYIQLISSSIHPSSDQSISRKMKIKL